MRVVIWGCAMRRSSRKQRLLGWAADATPPAEIPGRLGLGISIERWRGLVLTCSQRVVTVEQAEMQAEMQIEDREEP